MSGPTLHAIYAGHHEQLSRNLGLGPSKGPRRLGARAPAPGPQAVGVLIILLVGGWQRGGSRLGNGHGTPPPRLSVAETIQHAQGRRRSEHGPVGNTCDSEAKSPEVTMTGTIFLGGTARKIPRCKKPGLPGPTRRPSCA